VTLQELVTWPGWPCHNATVTVLRYAQAPQAQAVSRRQGGEAIGANQSGRPSGRAGATGRETQAAQTQEERNRVRTALKNESRLKRPHPWIASRFASRCCRLPASGGSVSESNRPIRQDGSIGFEVLGEHRPACTSALTLGTSALSCQLVPPSRRRQPCQRRQLSLIMTVGGNPRHLLKITRIPAGAERDQRTHP
jgi:hypothetical protein